MQSKDLKFLVNSNKSLLIKTGTILAVMFNLLMFLFLMSDYPKNISDYILFVSSIFLILWAREIYIQNHCYNKATIAVSIFFLSYAELMSLGFKGLHLN